MAARTDASVVAFKRLGRYLEGCPRLLHDDPWQSAEEVGAYSDADWAGWYVMEFSGDWYWVSKSTPPTPFEVLEGEQLLAE